MKTRLIKEYSYHWDLRAMSIEIHKQSKFRHVNWGQAKASELYKGAKRGSTQIMIYKDKY